MRYIFIFFWFFASVTLLNAQTIPENLQGRVSFISSENIYVKFISTEGISVGDTLFISSDGKLVPVLKVNNLSSTSCICTSFSGAKLSLSDQISGRKKTIQPKPEEKVIEKAEKASTVQLVPVASEKKEPGTGELKQKIRGSLSAYSYSDFSNTAGKNSTSFRYSLSLDARNIGNSKFSVESYLSFRHRSGHWNDVKSDLFNALKVYSLSVRFDPNKTTQISLGRRINPRISSIGAMDGLQVEKSINKFALGAVVGTRPDFIDYGFNSKLLQYGAYVSFNTVTQNTYSESSVAIMQQMNSMKTDRRFLYFQHSNSLIKNFYFMSTFEVDLYRLNSDTINHTYSPQGTFNLTGVYLSLRYRLTKDFTLSGSYDSRKNIMYFETYKTFIDRIIESEMRQSFRLQADYRITKSITLGLQSGYRFLKSDPHPSKNTYAYLTYYQIPGLNINLTISGTYLQSNYLNSKIAGTNISRDFAQGKFHTEIGYRYVNYTLSESHLTTLQNIGDFSVYWQISKYMSCSANYEGTFEKQDKYNRIYVQVRKRF